MGYGDRYMRVWEFVRYCKKINVETDEAELEYYESQGLMLPTARVVLPEDYVRLTSSTGGEYAQHDAEQDWPEIFRLYDRPLIVEADYASLTNEELLDSFDREFGHNPYLLKPSVAGFRPWNTYNVVVDEENEVRPSQAEHYYSYWQAHQLYAIQKFPDLYKNRHLIAELPARLRKKWHRPWAFDVEYYRTFRDQAASFDALSFFILMSYREKRRTFAALPAAYSIKRLNQQQHQDYIKRLSSHARFVAERYGIDEEDIYKFLRFLVDLYRDYRDAERLKLADAVKSDIIYQAHFASELTGKSWEELADELVKNARLGTKQTFLTLDKSTTVRRRAGMFLELKVKQHHQELLALSIQNPRYSFTNADITELTQFCEEHDLTILLEIIEGMIAVGENEREKFTRTGQYLSLKNMAMSFEYFLKALAASGGITLPNKATLIPVIQKLMKQQRVWISLFNLNSGLTSGSSLADFLTNVSQLLSDIQFQQSEDHYIARCFLMACLARNLSVHHYPTADWFYGDLFHDMLNAVVYAMFYSWQIAKREHWV